MNNVITTSRNSQSVRQLQVMAMKIGELAERSEALLKSSGAAVTEGLIAVGLCKQAREQVGAACQNLGFAIDQLLSFSAEPVEIDQQLRQTTKGVTCAIQHKIYAPAPVISAGIEAFVCEMLVIAAITIARAEEHVKAGERRSSGFQPNEMLANF